jgi:PAS domain-containing protein
MARRHDDWLRTGPWLAWLLSSLIAERNDTVMAAAREASERAITDDDAFAIAEWQAQLGVAHWMAGGFDEAQRLTEVGLALAEEIGADNLVMRNAFLRGTTFLVPGSDHSVAMPYFERAVRLGVRVGGNVLYGGAAWAMLLSARGEHNLSAAELARELATNLDAPMFLLDADGILTFFNAAAATLIGKTYSEIGRISGEEFGGVLHLTTTDGAPLRRRDSPAGVAFIDRRPAHQTLTATGYDGVRRVLDATAHPLFGPAGEWQGVVSVFWEHTRAADDRG